MTQAWQLPPQQPAPPTSPPFWKSGAGIALIIVIGVLLIPALCIFGCLGAGLIGAATDDPTSPPASTAVVSPSR